MDLPRILAEHWGLDGARVTALTGGMNSQTWLVSHDGGAYVAKSVPPGGAADLEAGGEIAAALAEVGFATGPPVPTRDGAMLLRRPAIALLRHVPGRELDGESDQKQEWMARTLAGVHTASSPARGPRTASFGLDWVSPRMPGVAAHPWLVGAIGSVRAETDPLQVTWSVLHTDPAPGAFVHDDATGVTGLIDWAGARRGPVLYDVASAVMYLGGTGTASAFLDVYRAHGPLSGGELEHLDAFRRLREVVQGVYFAGRLASDDLTGIADRSDNDQGLDDARRRLAALGVEPV